MPAPLDRDRVRRQLETLELRSLFIDDLGWDHGGADITAVVAGRTFLLEPLAQKRGFVAYRCLADSDDAFPDHPTRQKIERCVTRIVREHLVVYVASDRNTHYWQWVNRQAGRPDRTRTHTYNGGQSGEALIQKLEHLIFTLDEEDHLTILDPSERARAAFDVERVTKRFYDRFRKEHRAFLGFIEGIASLADREWYASLMLNRMMFVYFIQKRGFLDSDPDYLRHHLETVRREHGVGNFHSFYRLFLLRLFHEGLAQPQADRAPELAKLLGEVPYLNGGLFDVHDLERDNPDIHIPDEAFERIFGFFEAYQWHLDDRPLRNDNEINPDVLGYIFEKYVNQKQMGAYYTKEDITGYITRNTVIPFLFDRAREHCAIAFRPGGGVWRLLSDDPDRYFHNTMRHGISYDIRRKAALLPQRTLPPEIAAGIADVSKRGRWNEPAPPEYALATETWREHMARRQRYQDVRTKLMAGHVTSINDLITYNLDIETFARDVIAASEGPELVRAFWRALETVSILDPTCGSGAFLFAALNVLEPLCNACLDAMRGFLDDLHRSRRAHHREELDDFRAVLERTADHANERYFILKSIIIGNLYGVDLMEEAVEICKLRLFLKLVAQLERYDQIEPLPDIDFNVRADNALVGFTSLGAVRRTLSADMLRQLSLPQIEDRAANADRAFRQFRAMQTQHGIDAVAFGATKSDLRNRLDELRRELNEYLAGDYGVSAKRSRAVQQWRHAHQPFHWLVEFYGVMRRGGFDAIIGNPPYVEYSKVRKTYQVKHFLTERCGNLYALCTERSLDLLGANRRLGFIVQAPIVSTQRMSAARALIRSRSCFSAYATFDDRPSKLFQGMDHCRVCIILIESCNGSQARELLTTKYHKWYGEEAPQLMQLVQYTRVADADHSDIVPKLRSHTEQSIYRKALTQSRTLGSTVSARSTEHRIYYKITGVGHWFTFTLAPPRFWRRGAEGSSTRENSVSFPSALVRDMAFCCLWSTLHYLLYQARTNCRDFNPSDLAAFPVPESIEGGIEQFRVLARRIAAKLEQTSYIAEATYRVGGTVKYQAFRPKLIKPFADEIDRILASYYGFTNEELDFIVNYDIKYRMGESAPRTT
jgi:hypothetical protein